MYSHFVSPQPMAVNPINAQERKFEGFFSFFLSFFLPFHRHIRVKMPHHDSPIQKEYSPGGILTEAFLSPRPKGKHQNPESVQTPFSHQLTQKFVFEDRECIKDPVTQGSSLKLKRWTWQAVTPRPRSSNDVSGPLPGKKKKVACAPHDKAEPLPSPHPGDERLFTVCRGNWCSDTAPGTRTTNTLASAVAGLSATYGPDY